MKKEQLLAFLAEYFSYLWQYSVETKTKMAAETDLEKRAFLAGQDLAFYIALKHAVNALPAYGLVPSDIGLPDGQEIQPG